jgi:hypothetical protein
MATSPKLTPIEVLGPPSSTPGETHGGQMANLSVGEFIDKIEPKRTSLIDEMLTAIPYSAEQQGLIDRLEGFSEGRRDSGGCFENSGVATGLCHGKAC